MREYDLLIDGKPTSSSTHATYATRNPANGEQVALVPRASAQDARRALEAARRAADSAGWRDLPAQQRRRMLLAVADDLWERQTELADLDTAEAGIPIRASSALVSESIELFRRIVESGKDDAAPYGVVASIVPGDAPFARALGALGAALAGGNTLALACAPAAPGTALDIARACAESDLPPGTVNVIGAASDEILREFAVNPLGDFVSFEGSLEGARRIAEETAPMLKPWAFEPSQSSSALILHDADLDLAVPGVVWGAFFLSGQMSRHIARVYVPAADVEPVVHHLRRGAAAIRLGDPASFDVDAGPLTTPLQSAVAQAAIDGALAEGATLAVGGNPRESFYPPSVVVTNGSELILRQEHFAPLLCVVPYRDEREAIERADESAAGVSLWTRSEERAAAIARTLRSRRVWVNRAPEPLGARVAGDDLLRTPRVHAAALDTQWLGLLGLDRTFGLG